MTTNKNGFVPTTAARKLIDNARYAYIYSDGVGVVESKVVKVSKDIFTHVDIMHVYPCTLMLPAGIDRICLTNPSMLNSGIARIDAGKAKSDGTRDKGLTVFFLTITTQDGAVFTMYDILNTLSGDFSLQGNDYGIPIVYKTCAENADMNYYGLTVKHD